MRATSESAEWIFLATILGLEMLSAACDQASSPRKPHYALSGMLLAIAAVLISIWELIYRGKKERVVLRRWGMLWWFYHTPPPRHTPFGTLPDIYGLVAGISQCICSIVQYVYCLRHADNPIKASILPAIFLMCLGGSKLSKNQRNANTTDNKDSWENSSSTEETSLHPISKYYAQNIPFLDDQVVETNSNKFRIGMNLFQNAKAVRLRSHHDKYLLAEEDEVSVTQDGNGSSKKAQWTVEFVPESDTIIRLKSCFGKYLTASNQPYLLGMNGRKVLQTLPRLLDSSVEWEPIREGTQVRLRTRYGNFLQANGGPPPWRNSVTHDIPHRTATQDWVFWDVDIVEIHIQSPVHKPSAPQPLPHSDSLEFDSSSPSAAAIKADRFSRQEV
ncbi:unnamed protein product [Prunus armeniaca]